MKNNEFPDVFVKNVLLKYQNITGFMPNADIISLPDSEFIALKQRFDALFSCGEFFKLMYLFSLFVIKRQRTTG